MHRRSEVCRLLRRYDLLFEWGSVTAIARLLGVSPATISRDCQRSADADNQIGPGGDSGQIDVEQDDRASQGTVEGREVVGGVVAGEVL
jgi:hypothetical protein